MPDSSQPPYEPFGRPADAFGQPAPDHATQPASAPFAGGTPQPGGGQPAVAALASRGSRLGAALIDGLITGVPLIVVYSLGATEYYVGSNELVHPGLLVLGAILLVLAVAYAPVLLCRKGDRNGQTLGKQALGIRVVGTDGQPITCGRAFLRQVIGGNLLSLVPFYALVDILVIFTKRRQTLHDMIASTLVIDASAPTGAPVGPAVPHTSYAQPAGWYAAPDAPGNLRWWDGTRWTDHLRPDER